MGRRITTPGPRLSTAAPRVSPRYRDAIASRASRTTVGSRSRVTRPATLTPRDGGTVSKTVNTADRRRHAQELRIAGRDDDLECEIRAAIPDGRDVRRAIRSIGDECGGRGSIQQRPHVIEAHRVDGSPSGCGSTTRRRRWCDCACSDCTRSPANRGG